MVLPHSPGPVPVSRSAAAGGWISLSEAGLKKPSCRLRKEHVLLIAEYEAVSSNPFKKKKVITLL